MTHWWHQPLKYTRCISAASERWIVDGTDTFSFIECIQIKVCRPTPAEALLRSNFSTCFGAHHKKNYNSDFYFCKMADPNTAISHSAAYAGQEVGCGEKTARIESIYWTFRRNNGVTHDRGMKIQTKENSNYPSTPLNKKIILNYVFCLYFILDTIKRWYQVIWSEFC